MEIDPEAAVKFKDGKRAVSRSGLGRCLRTQRREQHECQENVAEACVRAAKHGESHDSSANSCGAQIRETNGKESGSLFGGNRVIIPPQLTCSRGPMKEWFRIAGLVSVLFLPALLFAQQSTELPALKQEAVAEVDRLQTFTQQMVDQIFSYSELGFQEFETSRYATGILEKNGFRVERGVAGIPTAWVATYGSGKPMIAYITDLDCIPQASQKPGVAYHDPLIEGAPGHGEGHNSGQPLNIIAAIAVKRWMEREKIPGTIKLWPGVAEELLGGKAFLVREGFFKDVDIALFTHVGNNLAVSWGAGTGTGLISVEYTFRGETAHAAAAPWRGRSALDAVELMDVGWNFRREHLRLDQRSHYVITNGGDQPNVVPALASVWYYFRELDYEHIVAMREMGDTTAKAASMMTNTTVTSRVLGSAWPGHFNKVIAQTMDKNIEKVGLPTWSDADQTLAKAL